MSARASASYCQGVNVDNFTDCEYSALMISTVDSVIDALGGTFEASKRLGVTPPAISNWKARGIIPADRYLAVTAALKVTNKSVDPRVFGFSGSAAWVGTRA